MHSSANAKCISVALLVLACYLMNASCEEGDLKTLIQTIGTTGSPDGKKQAFQALEKRASRGEYAVGEMTKRGVIKPLFDTITAENGDPLHKELALAVLSQMTMYSTTTCNSVIDEGLLKKFTTIIRRGTTTAQLHTVGILLHIANLGKSYKNKIITSGNEILEAVAFALRTGTKETRENAAALIVSLLPNELVKSQLMEAGSMEYLQKLTLEGTNRAKQHAARAIEKLGGEIPPEAVIPPYPKPAEGKQHVQADVKVESTSNQHTFGDGGADVRTHTYTFTAEGFAKSIEDPVKEWWGSSIKQTRRVAQNQYTLRSPSRFRHK